MTGNLIPYSATRMLGLGYGTTAEEARDRLQALGNDDPESAHGVEDSFLVAVLHAIANGHTDPVGLAKSALIVHSAEYSRWCA